MILTYLIDAAEGPGMDIDFDNRGAAVVTHLSAKRGQGGTAVWAVYSQCMIEFIFNQTSVLDIDQVYIVFGLIFICLGAFDWCGRRDHSICNIVIAF